MAFAHLGSVIETFMANHVPRSARQVRTSDVAETRKHSTIAIVELLEREIGSDEEDLPT